MIMPIGRRCVVVVVVVLVVVDSFSRVMKDFVVPSVIPFGYCGFPYASWFEGCKGRMCKGRRCKGRRCKGRGNGSACVDKMHAEQK